MDQRFKIGDRVIGKDKSSYSYGRLFTVISKCTLYELKPDLKSEVTDSDGLERYECHKLRLVTPLDELL